MGKLIVPLIISFLVGLSGGGFYSVFRTAATHGVAVADARKHGIKPAADTSMGAAEPGADSGAAHVTAAHDTGAHDAAEAPTGTPVAARPSVDAHGAATPTTPATIKPVVNANTSTTAAASTAPTAAETEAHQRRLAKIFATMGAKDAARVLGQMTDHDVSVILNLLQDRQAAAILINLPAPRAAALSQMQTRRLGGTE
ncbi:MAG TPA: hypothetical protein VE861_01695 [Gemmatimonadaceae bacterium]|nr:hypothetical protein [Gemmatimonadaceae bacterium]